MGNKRPYYGRDQWLKWILECRESGLTASAWCDLHGLNRNRFFKWRKKLIDEGAIEDYPLSPEQFQNKSYQLPNEDGRLPTVLQVNLDSLQAGDNEGRSKKDTCTARRDKPFTDSQILVETPLQGYRIHLGTGFDQDTLRKLLEVVQ